MRATAYLWLAFAASTALAQPSLEIIALKHRTADQIIPVLRPLLEPGASLSGQSGQLFVRTSPHNLAEIRAALARIDTPARRLQILVRLVEDTQRSQGGIEAGGRLSTRGDSRVEVRVDDSRSARDERIDQRLQVLEGARARIYAGTERPQTRREVIRTPSGPVVRESTTLQHAETGFDVIPRVSGSNVFLEIDPQRDTLTRGGGMQTGGITTSVSGRLGEWIALGGVDAAGSRASGAILSSGGSTTSSVRRVWVKVEEVKP